MSSYYEKFMKSLNIYNILDYQDYCHFDFPTTKWFKILHILNRLDNDEILETYTTSPYMTY